MKLDVEAGRPEVSPPLRLIILIYIQIRSFSKPTRANHTAKNADGCLSSRVLIRARGLEANDANQFKVRHMNQNIGSLGVFMVNISSSSAH